LSTTVFELAPLMTAIALPNQRCLLLRGLLGINCRDTLLSSLARLPA
jgi:hypothetical protein